MPIVEAVVASPAPPACHAPLSAIIRSRVERACGPAAVPRAAPAAANPLRRADELARRPDVRGLLALREEVAQRAASRGEQGHPKPAGSSMKSTAISVRRARCSSSAMQRSSGDPSAARRRPADDLRGVCQHRIPVLFPHVRPRGRLMWAAWIPLYLCGLAPKRRPIP